MVLHPTRNRSPLDIQVRFLVGAFLAVEDGAHRLIVLKVWGSLQKKQEVSFGSWWGRHRVT